MDIMANDTTIAFDQLEARADASSTSQPHDRIAVRDYTRDVEIGAFQVERGVRQRIKFNVVLEVSATDAAATDDVDQVLSYDTITEAIDYQLDVERLNLLETLAERIAAQILAHKQAIRVFVRIEKLDRIPGSLGVEIVRTSERSKDSFVSDNETEEGMAVHPLVVFLPNDLIQSKELGSWLDAIAEFESPAVICVEETAFATPRSDSAPATRRIELLSIEQNAWVLAGKDDRCVVVDSRTELDWAMKNGQLSVWAPSKMVLDATSKPASDAKPLDLAAWFAAEFSADHVSILGSGPFREKMRVVAEPGLLS
jgi:dihydroneopterin aldolase